MLSFPAENWKVKDVNRGLTIGKDPSIKPFIPKIRYFTVIILIVSSIR